MTSVPLASGFDGDLSLDWNLPEDFVPRLTASNLDREAVLLCLSLFQEFCRAGQPLIEAQSIEGLLGSTGAHQEALTSLVKNSFILRFTAGSTFYLPGTPAGRALLEKLQSGMLDPATLAHPPAEVGTTRPNIFELYEKNFGPLTAAMAEILKQDQQEYPAEWIEDAVKEALLSNARSWRYVQKVLQNWRAKGRQTLNEKDGRTLEEFRKLYQEQKRNRKQSS